jgi:CheY-like chemotaxis protein
MTGPLVYADKAHSVSDNGHTAVLNRSAAVAAPAALPPNVSHGFLDGYGQKAHALRQDFIRYRTAKETDRNACFEKFVEKVCALNAEAGQCGLKGLSFYLTAIEFRVKQLVSSLDSISSSSLQILASALDTLAALNNHITELEPLNNLSPHAMVVDDENVSRRTLCLGLEKSRFKTTGVDNPDAAILEAESKPFDIIFLDVGLPKMNGFALCARLRTIPSHRKTPILFVTSLNDVKSRASSRVSGGNQFLTKPVNLSELGINAWSLVIERRILHDGHRH